MEGTRKLGLDCRLLGLERVTTSLEALRGESSIGIFGEYKGRVGRWKRFGVERVGEASEFGLPLVVAIFGEELLPLLFELIVGELGENRFGGEVSLGRGELRALMKSEGDWLGRLNGDSAV